MAAAARLKDTHGPTQPPPAPRSGSGRSDPRETGRAAAPTLHCEPRPGSGKASAPPAQTLRAVPAASARPPGSARLSPTAHPGAAVTHRQRPRSSRGSSAPAHYRQGAARPRSHPLTAPTPTCSAARGGGAAANGSRCQLPVRLGRATGRGWDWGRLRRAQPARGGEGATRPRRQRMRTQQPPRPLWRLNWLKTSGGGLSLMWAGGAGRASTPRWRLGPQPRTPHRLRGGPIRGNAQAPLAYAGARPGTGGEARARRVRGRSAEPSPAAALGGPRCLRQDGGSKAMGLERGMSS